MKTVIAHGVLQMVLKVRKTAFNRSDFIATPRLGVEIKLYIIHDPSG